jgi:hypothetical protein
MWADYLEPAPSPPGPAVDPLDDLIGRAIIDRAFGRALLADPATALAPTAMPLRLKLALVTIRVDSLGQFARRALAARAALAGQR